jgi:hypothetical protein
MILFADDPLGVGGSGAHGSSPFVITRATERLTHAFNDGKAYLVDRWQ